MCNIRFLEARRLRRQNSDLFHQQMHLYKSTVKNSISFTDSNSMDVNSIPLRLDGVDVPKDY
jgi:hypothetical protein